MKENKNLPIEASRNNQKTIVVKNPGTHTKLMWLQKQDGKGRYLAKIKITYDLLYDWKHIYVLVTPIIPRDEDADIGKGEDEYVESINILDEERDMPRTLIPGETNISFFGNDITIKWPNSLVLGSNLHQLIHPYAQGVSDDFGKMLNEALKKYPDVFLEAEKRQNNNVLNKLRKLLDRYFNGGDGTITETRETNNNNGESTKNVVPVVPRVDVDANKALKRSQDGENNGKLPEKDEQEKY